MFPFDPSRNRIPPGRIGTGGFAPPPGFDILVSLCASY